MARVEAQPCAPKASSKTAKTALPSAASAVPCGVHQSAACPTRGVGCLAPRGSLCRYTLDLLDAAATWLVFVLHIHLGTVLGIRMVTMPSYAAHGLVRPKMPHNVCSAGLRPSCTSVRNAMAAAASASSGSPDISERISLSGVRIRTNPLSMQTDGACRLVMGTRWKSCTAHLANTSCCATGHLRLCAVSVMCGGPPLQHVLNLHTPSRH